jgi:hypothetical protein
MQHAYQMSTNRALKAKPLAVKGSVEWAESSLELERVTSRNSTDCGYSYIRYAPRGRAKSGMQRFQNRQEKADRSTFIFPLARIHEFSTPKSGANPRCKALHWKIRRKSGHRRRHSRELRFDRERQCHPSFLLLATNWHPDLEIKIVLGRAWRPAIGRCELENR